MREEAVKRVWQLETELESQQKMLEDETGRVEVPVPEPSLTLSLSLDLRA